MAGRISEFSLLATPAADDLIEVIDVSDTTMAPSGTNKKSPISALAGGLSFYGGARVPFNQGFGGYPSGGPPGGLPGRILTRGSGGVGLGIGVVFGTPFFVSSGEVATFDRWVSLVETGQASAKMNNAVYSVPSFADGVTGTKIASTEVVDIDHSTTGEKQMMLAAPVTLPPGQYHAVHLVHGSVSSPTVWAFQGDPGFTGVDMRHSSNSLLVGGLNLATGQTTLSSTYLFASWAVGTTQGHVIALMRNWG